MQQGRRVGGMKRRTAAWLAWSLCVLTIALVTFVVVFSVFYRDNLRDLAFLLAVVSNALVGAVLASHRPTVLVTRSAGSSF